MPYRPSLRSIWTLVILAVVAYGLYLWCESSHVQKRLPYYDEKLAAATLMDRALHVYQDYRSEKGVFGSEYQDPRLDAIIGQQFSAITTELGIFESKLIGANPNFAAVAVDLLAKAGIGRGDLVAVGFTASNPGVNTAVLCACEVLGATPVTIATVGSSWWGATDPDFTWLDMEHLLNERGLIHSRPIAASMGGVRDVAVGLSAVGQELIRAAASRNGVSLIEERTLEGSVAARMTAYREAAGGKRYKAYVNVGNGVASLGHPENGRLIRNGFNRRLPVQNYPARGVIHSFNSDGIPTINIFDIEKLSRDYGLGGGQVPLPAVGEGEVYVAERYDTNVAGVSAAITILLILILVRLDARFFRLKDSGVDPDTLM